MVSRKATLSRGTLDLSSQVGNKILRATFPSDKKCFEEEKWNFENFFRTPVSSPHRKGIGNSQVLKINNNRNYA
jgi:hypothetical protein